MNQTNENSSAGARPAVRTWRERMGVSLDFPLSMPSSVERAMEEEIAELRAALVATVTPTGAAMQCAHENGTYASWTHVTCKECGAVKTDGAWGIASRTWFKSLFVAKFYQAHGRLPVDLKAGSKA